MGIGVMDYKLGKIYNTALRRQKKYSETSRESMKSATRAMLVAPHEILVFAICLFLICTIHLYYYQIMLAWMQNSRSSRSTKVSKTKLIGLILGPVLFFILLVSPAPEGLPDQGKLVAGITLWLVVWWVTEAVSIYATALLPLALFPITGVLSLRVGGSRIHEPNNYSSIGDVSGRSCS